MWRDCSAVTAGPTRIYDQELAPLGCHVRLSTGLGRIPPAPDPPSLIRDVRSGDGGLAVNTQCPEIGEVRLEVWAR